MNATLELIEAERQGNTLVLTPQQDLRELEYERIEDEQRELLARLAADPSIRNVVVDFGRTDCFGSAALNLLIRLWKAARNRGGRVGLCNVSAHEQDTLEATRLAGFWRAYASRTAAVEAVNG